MSDQYSKEAEECYISIKQVTNSKYETDTFILLWIEDSQENHLSTDFYSSVVSQTDQCLLNREHMFLCLRENGRII